MNPLTDRRNPAHRSKRKAFLFCRHPVAQERFVHSLSRAGFDVVVNPLRRCDSELGSGTPADVAVIDSSDAESALDFVRSLRLEQPQLPVLVLLPTLESPQIYCLLRFGVKGVLSYRQAQRGLSHAVGEVANGGYFVPHELLTGFIESILPELYGGESLLPEVEISRREREVLDLLLENLSNKEIAARLFVSERTVKFHVSNLLSKFGVSRRAELLVLWMRRSPALSWAWRERGQVVSAPIN